MPPSSPLRGDAAVRPDPAVVADRDRLIGRCLPLFAVGLAASWFAHRTIGHYWPFGVVATGSVCLVLVAGFGRRCRAEPRLAVYCAGTVLPGLALLIDRGLARPLRCWWSTAAG